MYAEERQREILERVRREGKVSVDALTEALGVSAPTVRADLGPAGDPPPAAPDPRRGDCPGNDAVRAALRRAGAGAAIGKGAHRRGGGGARPRPRDGAAGRRHDHLRGRRLPERARRPDRRDQFFGSRLGVDGRAARPRRNHRRRRQCPRPPPCHARPAGRRVSDAPASGPRLSRRQRRPPRRRLDGGGLRRRPGQARHARPAPARS